MTRLIQKIRTKIGQMDLLSDMWNIGFVTEDIADVVKSDKLHIHWLKHNYTDRWFADPFLLEVTEKQIIVLVEEFCYKIRKGRIARLVISRPDYVLQDMKIVLEMPYHLSFPVICQKDGKTLVFVEVKTRSNLNCGHPFEAINVRKMQKIMLAIPVYIEKNDISCSNYRIDLIAVIGLVNLNPITLRPIFTIVVISSPSIVTFGNHIYIELFGLCCLIAFKGAFHYISIVGEIYITYIFAVF